MVQLKVQESVRNDSVRSFQFQMVQLKAGGVRGVSDVEVISIPNGSIKSALEQASVKSQTDFNSKWFN